MKRRRKGFRSPEEQAAAMIRMKKPVPASRRPPRPASRKGGESLPRYNLNTLRLYLMGRGPGSFISDLLQSHARTGPHTDEKLVRAWIRGTGRADIIGVDTPGSEYPDTAGGDRPSFTINPLHGQLYMVEVEGHTRRRITPRLQKSRQKQIKALERTRDMLKQDLANLEDQGKQSLSKKARKDRAKKLREGRRVLANVEAQLAAFRDGKLLLVGKKKDRRLIDQYAALARQAFELDPRSMDVAAVYIGTARGTNALGYTHPIESPGKYPVTVPFVALNDAFYKLDTPLASPEARPRRLTMTHELVHVLRKHESGRPHKVTQSWRVYGGDRDREEAHTVLETQLHAGAHGNRATESYYSFLRDVPEDVGAEDNRIVRGSRIARRVKGLRRINEAMQARADKTHIHRLHNDGDQWGERRNPEHIDRVLQTSDGDVIQVYNPTGIDTGDMAAFVDSLDGDEGDRVWEYRDGRLGPVQGTRRRRRRESGRDES